MKKQLIAVAILAMMGTTSAFAGPNPTKGGSFGGGVVVGDSDFPSIPIIAPDGYAALSMRRNDGTTFSGFIPLRAPVLLTTTVATANTNGTYIAGIPLLMPNIAQVWRTDTTYNATAETFSLRQLSYPAAPWPHFGGLVIGRVAGTGATDGVYFGEWSPAKAGGPDAVPSTDLNMGSSGRTVWYVGDNPTTSMPTLANVTYNVVGIRGVGTSAGNQPYAPDLYTGALVANYSGGSGSITGSIANSSGSVNFAGTNIVAAGTFSNGSTIEGRFYNNANALAGIYKDGGAGSVAFGGKR